MIGTAITMDISVEAYDRICRDIREQPKWRLDSDTDCDYYDGAQTSAEVVQRLKDAGIPPQESNLIKPTINAVLGLEARTRTDYRVTSDDESQAEIAEGLSARIKEAETESRADRAMSDAYSSMIRGGIGWVEVSREFDPLKYPYRVREVHRNEIYWDWTAREPDLSDARYLRRDKWVDRVQASLMLPDQAELIQNSWSGWNNLDVYDGADTGMARAFETEQTWGRSHEDYLNRNSGMVRLSELWYRHFEEGHVLVLPDGKAIEYREDNFYHQAAVAQGLVEVQKSLLTRMRVSIWLGPHKLMDVPSPLPHTDFPYIPFWCFRKDRSRAPYGLIRDMRGPQDQIIDLDILLYEVLNSVKVEVDNDALDLSQNSYQEVAQNISSLRSMTVLNAQRRNAGGFKITREYQLAAQVFQLVQERKKRIEEVGGIYRAMLGADTTASSGVAINSLVEQGSTVLAEPNDNFRYARRMVGQQLLSLIRQDMLGNAASVAVKHGAGQKIVYFNRQVMTDSGPAIENDIATAQVKVVLEDIPATASFRAQQLHAFTQIVQAAPPAYQAVLYPAMLELSDVPNRHALADQLRNVGNVNPGSGQQAQALQQRFDAAMQQQAQIVSGLQAQLIETQQALVDKSRELDSKERGLDIGQDKNRTDAGIKADN
ncbi:hypothetical protein SAMN05216386_0703 [Nitrosospira briensis]|uniref:Phage P22-like portal protein n=1 Tax=Nitrosospira briensis TaxID=35799 RepID=A0A1I4YHZ9_9PROT|nr:phage portal protein [Nitrosospira briensis]SFN37463.1 hypothetical protein SAMN05216386_0703 [Nitrosospira briensis]